MRCKVSCGAKIDLGNGGFALSFYAVYSGSEENDKYFKAIPSATILIQTINEKAAANFEIGKQYYIDFSPA